MTTTSCPTCGKPLRPGAKFCGSCGNEVTVGSPQPAATPQQTNGNACPHCGKPVRLGAKFCNNCGEVIFSEAAQPAVIIPEQAEAHITAPGTAVAPRVVPPPIEKPKPTRSKLWIWLVVLFIIIVCALIGVATFMLRDNVMGLIGFRTATQTPLSPTETSATPPVDTTPLLSPTIPSATLTITESTVISPTDIVTTSVVISTPIPITNILLDDNFDIAINLNWEPWGLPRPAIIKAPTDNYLELRAEESGSAGITAKMDISSTPGVIFEFDASMNKLTPRYRMIFDWDPVDTPRRGPETSKLGVIRFELQETKLTLKGSLIDEKCERDINGVDLHTFILKIVDGQGVELYVDEDTSPICRIEDMGREPTPGRISFSGLGWVTRVLVTGPEG